jgi:predicted TIM-barrel fold metal-dependent hydrolase
MLDPLVQNLFKCAEITKMPVTFHISPTIGDYYGLHDQVGLPQLEESLKRFPKLKFFGHSAAFWAEMSPLKSIDDRYGYPGYPIEKEGAVPRLMRKYDNLYGDLSAGSGYNALHRDRKYAIRFIEEFQDRLMFGTDICSPDTPTPLADFLLSLKNNNDISEKIFHKLAKGNAVRILQI